MFEVNIEERTIYLYDVIGADEWWGDVSADDLHKALQELGSEPVTLRVSSPGGDVWEALRMFNSIAEHGDVHVRIDALAASAASYIVMAAKTVSMAENALMMIHGPWTIAMGNSKDFRELAERLEQHGKAIAKGYAAKSSKSVDEILEMFDGEFWYTSDEALAAKFVDTVEAPSGIAAKINNRMFRFERCPEGIAASVQRFEVELPKPPEPEVPEGGFARREAAKAKIAALAEVE